MAPKVGTAILVGLALTLVGPRGRRAAATRAARTPGGRRKARRAKTRARGKRARSPIVLVPPTGGTRTGSREFLQAIEKAIDPS